MKTSLFVCLFLGSCAVLFSQEFKKSKEFILTKIEYNSLSKIDLDETPIFITDTLGNKIQEILVSGESYENDSYVEELSNVQLKNIKKVVKVIISHCACYCNNEHYYYLLNNNNDWIPLPVIVNKDFEFEMLVEDYEFPINSKKNVINRNNYYYQIVENKITLKSKKFLQSYNWNGKSFK